MAEKKLTLSEFKSKDNLTKHYKDNIACTNLVKDSIEIKIKRGELIPEIFIKNLLINNTSQVEIETKDSIPQLSKEQQKKYGIDIAQIIEKKKEAEPKTDKEVVDKQFPKWNMENLNVKLGKLGSKEFKIWCEKEFGEEKIDKRKSSDSIIVIILKLQDEGKLNVK